MLKSLCGEHDFMEYASQEYAFEEHRFQEYGLADMHNAIRPANGPTLGMQSARLFGRALLTTP
jgi:hypothetical protein